MLGALEKVNDESDKDNKLRLVLEPRSSRQDPDEFMRFMLAHTSLEENFPVNLVVLGPRRAARRARTSREIVGEWVQFRIITVTRRSKFRLGAGRAAHPHPRRPHHRPAQHRQGDQGHPRLGRAQARPDEALQADRGAGRGHPRDPAAAARAPRRHQDRERAEGAEGRAQGPEGAARQRRRDEEARRRRRSATTRRNTATSAARTIEEAGARRSSARSSTSRSRSSSRATAGCARAQGHGLDLAGITYKTGDGPYAIFETRSVHSVAVDRLHRPRVQRRRLRSSPAARATACRSPRSSSSRRARGSRTWSTRSPGKRYLVANSGGYGFIVESRKTC